MEIKQALVRTSVSLDHLSCHDNVTRLRLSEFTSIIAHVISHTRHMGRHLRFIFLMTKAFLNDQYHGDYSSDVVSTMSDDEDERSFTTSSAAEISIKKFTYFPKLAALRQIIWRLVEQQPRIIEVTDRGTKKAIPGRFKKVGELHSDTPVPALLHVCQEARAIDIKLYDQKISDSVMTTVYFNFYRDTIFVSSTDAMTRMLSNAVYTVSVVRLVISGIVTRSKIPATEFSKFKKLEEVSVLDLSSRCYDYDVFSPKHVPTGIYKGTMVELATDQQTWNHKLNISGLAKKVDHLGAANMGFLAYYQSDHRVKQGWFKKTELLDILERRTAGCTAK